MTITASAMPLYEIIKDEIKPDIFSGLYDYYEDFEVEVLNKESEHYENVLKLSRKIMVVKNNELSSRHLCARVVSGLVTDSSGYCHKIAINKNIEVDF